MSEIFSETPSEEESDNEKESHSNNEQSNSIDDKKKVAVDASTSGNSKINDGASTSAFAAKNPIQICDNMNDLNVHDYNSADDVRQRLKALISEKDPEYGKEPSENICKGNMHIQSKGTGRGSTENIENQGMPNGDRIVLNERSCNKSSTPRTLHSAKEGYYTSHIMRGRGISLSSRRCQGVHIGSRESVRALSHDGHGPENKKRGRPASKGPSKKRKKSNVTDFYCGKLDNIVKFGSESDSDDSFIFQ